MNMNIEQIFKEGIKHAIGRALTGVSQAYYRNYAMALKYANQLERLGEISKAKIIKDKVSKYIREEKDEIDEINSVFNCNVCSFPDTDRNKLLLCSKCRQAHYCSQKCQKKDWNEHKKKCGRRENDRRRIFQIAPSSKSITNENRIIAPFYFYEDENNREMNDLPFFFIISGLKIKKINRHDMKYLKRVFDIPSVVKYHHFSKAFECPICSLSSTKGGIVLTEVMNRTIFTNNRIENSSRAFPRITHQKCLEKCVLINCYEDPVFHYDTFLESGKGICHVWDLITPDYRRIQKECWDSCRNDREFSSKYPNLKFKKP